MHRSLLIATLALALVPATLAAQGDAIKVRTFTLQSLSPGDAARLASPYLLGMPMSGVFEVGGGIKAITVRGTSEMLSIIDSLIRANDRPPMTLILRFQLIVASDSAVRDPATGPVDAELRNLFRFAGYRLLSQGTAIANERQAFSLTMPGVGTDLLRLNGELTSVQGAGTRGNAELRIWLTRALSTPIGGIPGQGVTVRDETLLSTGLTVPLGQTVVLGSAAYGKMVPAIILAVRPELVPTKP